MRISEVEIKDRIILIKWTNDVSYENLKQFSNELSKLGAIKVIGLAEGIELQSFSDEDLKEMGLKRI